MTPVTAVRERFLGVPKAYNGVAMSTPVSSACTAHSSLPFLWSRGYGGEE